MALQPASHRSPTGGTYYAYPADLVTYSLEDWTTHWVQLVELAAPNLGMYVNNLDDDKGFDWLVFSGASQPANADAAVATIALDKPINVNAIVSAMKADANLINSTNLNDTAITKLWTTGNRRITDGTGTVVPVEDIIRSGQTRRLTASGKDDRVFTETRES